MHRTNLTGRRRALAYAAMTAAVVAGLSGCGSDDQALGTAAEVDFYPSEGGIEPVSSGTVAVTDVRKGSSAELIDAGFDLDPDEESATVYYVDAEFENSGDAAAAPRAPGGEDPDGNAINPLVVIDLGGPAFEKCDGGPKEIAAGGSAATCTILLVPDGTELDRISYFAGGTEDFLYWETGL